MKPLKVQKVEKIFLKYYAKKKHIFQEIPNILNESSRSFQNQWTGDLKSMTILEKMFVFKECILSLVKKSDLLLQPHCTCTTVF